MSAFFLGFCILAFFFWLINCEQNYSADSVLSCNNSDQTGPSSAFLYTCNGLEKSCRAFLIFISKPPYNSVPSISTLTSSNQEELARINNVTRLAVFPTNKEVIVPLNCSCNGPYYQANTTFVLRRQDTYYTVATYVFEGSATCSSLKRANQYNELRLMSGMKLQVPLRCACPTRNQVSKGTKQMLTYLVSVDDKVSDIEKRFNVSKKSILDANGLSQENPTLFPSTTILVPLQTEPSSSQTIIRKLGSNITPSSSSHKPDDGSKRSLELGIVRKVCFFLLLLGVSLLVVYLFYRRRQKGKRSSQSNGRARRRWVSKEELLVEISSLERELKVFEFKEVKKATSKFSTKNRISGSVYRGLFDKKILAVKKTVTDASKEFSILKKINHFNLTKLEGICQNHGHFYLLFEYMENGTLKEWLSSTSRERWSWTKRVQIALDVAHGLQYLHSFTNPPYVHNYINSSNILLNRDLRAKISNFRLARPAQRETAHAFVTENVVVTNGYMAPECKAAGPVTPKIDVYAFGVVILELITGKEAVVTRDGKEVLLSAEIVSVVEGKDPEAELAGFVDPSIAEQGRMQCAWLMSRLSVACLNPEPERRPSMVEVVWSLLKIEANVHKRVSEW